VFVPEIFEPVIAAVQAKAPVAFVMVHPVDPTPPPIKISPVEVLFKFKAPEEPPLRLKALAPVDVTDPVAAKVKDVADTPIVSMEATPVNAPPVVTFSPPFDVNANVPVEFPTVTFPVPVVAIVTLLAPALAKSVAPVEVNVVNLPVEGVVVPIAVELIPVAVVLKLEEVNVNALAPVEIEEADKPERVKAPEVPVRFKAPVVSVSPLLAVTSPEKVGFPTVAKVIVPAPLFVVVIFVPAARVSVPPCEIEELEPVVEAAVNKLPALTRQVGQVRVNVPPSASAPPPLNGPVVFTVTDELAKLAFVIPALPDKLELVNPAIVVLVTPVTLPCASVVMTGIFVADP
jgi:hypothetical protein